MTLRESAQSRGDRRRSVVNMSVLLVAVCAVVVCALLIALHEKRTNALCRCARRLEGRTALVTGGTSGMGLCIAEELARRGARVIVACPFPQEGAAALAHIRARLSTADVLFELLDLGSMSSVRDFTARLLARETRLDILVNNAAVGVPRDCLTPDNMNFIMQVNYFGTFQLTLLLLPLLIKSGTEKEPSRIINTSSVSHWIGTVELDRLNTTGHYWPLVRVYANSKLCQLLFTHELGKRLAGQPVTVNCVDPGAVGTRIFESGYKVVGMVLSAVISRMFKTAAEGAQTALHVALSAEAARGSGRLYRNCRVSWGAARSRCDVTAAALWDYSRAALRFSPADVDACFRSL